MHAHERDCVLRIPVKGDHRVPVGIILSVEAGRQCFLDDDHVLAGIEMIDCDCADQMGSIGSPFLVAIGRTADISSGRSKCSR